MPTHSTDHIIRVLRANGLDAHEHNLGLAANCADPETYAQALMRCNPDTTLRILTMTGQQGIPQHDCHADPMICECATHTADRSKALRRGAHGAGHQPWIPRTSRRAA